MLKSLHLRLEYISEPSKTFYYICIRTVPLKYPSQVYEGISMTGPGVKRVPCM